MATTEAATRSAATARYARKKQAIVAAASDILNHHGVKGMTLAGVASRVGLITNHTGVLTASPFLLNVSNEMYLSAPSRANVESATCL